MQTLQARAPGKLMLSGEYAVLEGAPAVVLAVDRQVEVTIRETKADHGRLIARPLAQDALSFDLGSNYFWRDETSAHRQLGMTARLLPMLIQHLAQPIQQAVFELEIDSSALFDRSFEGNSIKLGLGSSAATAVALFRALAQFFSHSTIEQPLQQQLNELLPLYRRALQSPASGADLAASLFGGVVSVQADSEQLHVQREHWPEGLLWTAIWTMQAAQTTDFVGRYQRWQARDPNARNVLQPLFEQAIAVLTAVRSNNADQLLESLRQYTHSMAEMDGSIQTALDHSGSGTDRIITPSHRALIDQASAQHVLYKTCGAGGGDLGIALGCDSERLGVFIDGLSPMPARPLKLSFAPETIER
ncbi:MAG: hypothetical protein AAF446_00115 [Pseudomonadota bacterium]